MSSILLLDCNVQEQLINYKEKEHFQGQYIFWASDDAQNYPRRRGGKGEMIDSAYTRGILIFNKF